MQPTHDSFLRPVISTSGRLASYIAFSFRRGEVNDEYFETYLLWISIAGCNAGTFTGREHQHSTGQRWTAAGEKQDSACSPTERWPAGVRAELFAVPQSATGVLSANRWNGCSTYACTCGTEQRGRASHSAFSESIS